MKFELATSLPLLREVSQTMRYPRVQRYGPFTDEDIERIDRVCAMESEAEYVVTDDRRHLLPLESIRVAGHRTILIVSPAAFLRQLD